MVQTEPETGKTGLPAAPPAFSWISRAVLITLILAGGVVLWLWSTKARIKPDLPIAQQWIDAVSQLGVEPAYPPQEDISVGDILAVITSDAKRDIRADPLPQRAVKLWHENLTKEIEQAYGEVYQFPETQERPADGKIWRQGKGETPLFKLKRERDGLPLVILPEMTMATVRASSSGTGMLSGIAASLGLDAGSAISMRVKIEGAETYGVPAIPAQWRLIDFCGNPETKAVCTDRGLRLQLSTIAGADIFEMMPAGPDGKVQPRFGVELALVSRVFLTRSIETVIERAAGWDAKASMPQIPVPQVSAPSAPPPGAVQLSPQTASVTGEPSGEGDGGAAMPVPPAGSGGRTLGATSERPGSSISVRRLDASTLAVTQVLQRPVAVGFRTVRWRPSSPGE